MSFIFSFCIFSSFDAIFGSKTSNFPVFCSSNYGTIAIQLSTNHCFLSRMNTLISFEKNSKFNRLPKRIYVIYLQTLYFRFIFVFCRIIAFIVVFERKIQSFDSFDQEIEGTWNGNLSIALWRIVDMVSLILAPNSYLKRII